MNSALSSREKAPDRARIALRIKMLTTRWMPPDLALLLLRIWVGQEFLFAGYTKLSSGLHAPAWFAGLNFPPPLAWMPVDLNWIMAGAGELIFSVALILGVWGRLAACGLLIITYVAIHTVHFDLGWAGWNQIETESGLGFKVPLMLAVMLAALIAQGTGRLSLQQTRSHP